MQLKEQETVTLKALTEAYNEACDRREYALCDILREEIRKNLVKDFYAENTEEVSG